MNFKVLAFLTLVIININSNDIEKQNIEFLKLNTGEKDINSNFYDVYNFVRKLFKKWGINKPLEVTGSIKISDKGINNKRYEVLTPFIKYLNLNEKQINELLSFIPDDTVKETIKNQLINETGGLIYAVDAFNKKKYKTFADLPEKLPNQINKIVGYEWLEEDKKNIVKRTHTSIKNYKDYIKKYLVCDEQKSTFNELAKFIVLNKNLLRNDKNKESIYFGFKNNVLVKNIKDILLKLTAHFRNIQNLSSLLDQIGNYRIYWIQLEDNAITIYTKL